MREWFAFRAPPEIHDAVVAAASAAWQERAEWLRQAVVAKLRAEGRLPPHPARRIKAAVVARDREAA